MAGRVRLVWFAAALTLSAVTVLAALQARQGEAAAPSPYLVMVSSSEQKNKPNNIPIARGKKPNPRTVAISMSPGKLPSLAPGDRLVVSAELPTTTDCVNRNGDCFKSNGYGYDPRVSARLVLSNGGQAEQIGKQLNFTCTQKSPRNHHCPIVFAGASVDIAAGDPCVSGGCKLQLLVGASSKNAQKGGQDRLLLGGSVQSNGRVPFGGGRLNAVRIRPAPPPMDPVGEVSADTTPAPSMEVSPGGKLKKKVILSAPIDRLRAGAQLAIAAAMQTNLGGLRYPTLVSSKVILSCRDDDIKPCKKVTGAVSDEGEFGPVNGFNCVKGGSGGDDFRSPCVSNKVGVLKVRGDIQGRTYVNFVAAVNAKEGGTPKAGDRVKVTGGTLLVVKYGKALKG